MTEAKRIAKLHSDYIISGKLPEGRDGKLVRAREASLKIMSSREERLMRKILRGGLR